MEVIVRLQRTSSKFLFFEKFFDFCPLVKNSWLVGKKSKILLGVRQTIIETTKMWKKNKDLVKIWKIW